MFKIYVDLDGVLCDFEKRAEETIEGFEGFDTSNDVLWPQVEAYGSKWWSGMDWMEGSRNMWNFLRSLTLLNRIDVDSVQVLSAYPSSGTEEAIKGKLDWIEKNLGERYKRSALIVERKEKSKYSNPNSMLIDDLENNIKSWNEKGGVGILHTDKDSTVQQIMEHFKIK